MLTDIQKYPTWEHSWGCLSSCWWVVEEPGVFLFCFVFVWGVLIMSLIQEFLYPSQQKYWKSLCALILGGKIMLLLDMFY